jgi:hypothetical protein
MAGNRKTKPKEKPIEARAEVCFLLQRLRNAGFSAGLSHAGSGIRNPDASLPSRMLQYPVEYWPAEHRRDGMPALLLRHPRLAEDPFIATLSEAVDYPVNWEEHDQYGRERSATPSWWHAVDLVIEKRVDDLLRTRYLTDDHCLAGAVTYGLDYGHMTTDIARRILAELGAPEADATLDEYMRQGKLSLQMRGKSPGAHFGKLDTRLRDAWFRVLTIEAGYVRRKGDFLQVTPMGKEALESVQSARPEAEASLEP